MPDKQVAIPSGLVCTTTYGVITHQTAQALMEMRAHSEKQGLANVQWMFIPGTLVEKARNEAVRQMLKAGAGWLLQVDGDMTFAPDSLQRLLVTIYGEMPHLDALGAYCPLRGELALPTIDTGTGTWESHFPGSGVLEVMRTGGAFLLVKRHVFEGLRDPWFRMRVPARPVDFLAEVDNFCNIKFDGRNPFRGLPGREWERLEKAAQEDPSAAAENFTPIEVGEDSGFCDRARNAGFRLAVHTDVVCGHVDQKVTTWQDHKRAMENMERLNKQCGGRWA